MTHVRVLRVGVAMACGFRATAEINGEPLLPTLQLRRARHCTQYETETRLPDWDDEERKTNRRLVLLVTRQTVTKVAG
jgi:hypothetical protein